MRIKSALALVLLLALPLPAAAQTIQSIDDAPNDTFGDRVTVAPGASRIFGQLEPPEIPETDYSSEETLNQSEVNTFTITGLPAEEPFFAWVDSDESMDTIMAQFDGAENLLAFDDDSSPFGLYAPAIRGVVPSSGTLILKVSGIGDDDFDGFLDYYEPGFAEPGFTQAQRDPHYEMGDYTLSVLTGEENITGDLDFFSLSGLTPGDVFSVAVSLTEYGASIGWLADDGSLISRSVYAESSNREQVSGLVPASGEVHLVVTGYDDFSFEGDHGNSGDYVLVVETRAIESP
ncbi:MAG: hypothetical protein ACFB5Z_08855 [Elainellaceae cyanobacterium]